MTKRRAPGLPLALPLACVALAACSAASKGADRPGDGSAAAGAAGAPTTPGEDEAAQQEARLAAIQHAMNELDEAAQLCWAASAAVDGYQLAGELAFTIDIDRPPRPAQVALARDNTKTPRLIACLEKLLGAYPWAPPLYGQAIQLPFAFRAPDGQNVVDRRLVPFVAQGKVSVAVLLDEQNSGNGKVSMFELALAPGATTELRQTPRAEAWFFLGAAAVLDSRGSKTDVAAGDVMLVPANSLRQVTAPANAPLSAVVVVTPGGHEGSARLGALPTPLATLPAAQRKALAPAVIVRSADSQLLQRPNGSVSLTLDPARTRRGEFSAALLSLGAGASVPLHDHAGETELLYILEGAGTMTVDGVSLAVTPSSAVQVPPGAKHSFTATAPLRALQFYTPAGPEQRFKAAPAPPPKVP